MSTSSSILSDSAFKDASIRSPEDLAAAGLRVIYRPETGPGVSAVRFMALAGQNAGVAFRLFGLCEWQSPETLLDEDKHAKPEDRCFPELAA